MCDSNGIINVRPMIMPANRGPGRRTARRGRISSILVSVTSLLRGLPLFISARPRSPLRVLCIMAFDTLHTFRNSKRLPTSELRLLAVCLDFEACANAELDSKDFCRNEFRTTLRLLEDAGMTASVAEFSRRLSELERKRPSPGGDLLQFQRVRSYREAVVRLSLAMVAATAFGNQSIESGIQETHCDEEFNLLFRIAMQCQIIDDVLDYTKDASAGLPGFLTASASLPQAFELTRQAALGYADDRDLPRSAEAFSLRLVLAAVSDCTRLVIALGRWRQKSPRCGAYHATDRLEGLPIACVEPTAIGFDRKESDPGSVK